MSQYLIVWGEGTCCNGYPNARIVETENEQEARDLALAESSRLTPKQEEMRKKHGRAAFFYTRGFSADYEKIETTWQETNLCKSKMLLPSAVEQLNQNSLPKGS